MGVKIQTGASGRDGNCPCAKGGGGAGAWRIQRLLWREAAETELLIRRKCRRQETTQGQANGGHPLNVL